MIHKPSAGDGPELEWFKSSYSSNGNEGDCVEVATSPGAIYVRDSKNLGGPSSPSSWVLGWGLSRTPAGADLQVVAAAGLHRASVGRDMIRNLSADGGHDLEWRKSGYSSNSSEADCVEVAPAPGRIHVRDSKNVPGLQLGFTPTAWTNFVVYASGN